MLQKLTFHTYHTISILSLPLVPMSISLLRLTTIRPSSLRFLVSTHTRSQCDVYIWRSGKPKALGDFDQVEFVDIKY